MGKVKNYCPREKDIILKCTQEIYPKEGASAAARRAKSVIEQVVKRDRPLSGLIFKVTQTAKKLDIYTPVSHQQRAARIVKPTLKEERIKQVISDIESKEGILVTEERVTVDINKDISFSITKSALLRLIPTLVAK